MRDSTALPPSLHALDALCLDLRWTWCHSADPLWRSIDPARWSNARNPWLILQNLSTARLAELAANASFLAELQRLDAQRQQYLEAPSWYSADQTRAHPINVAYFSMEYGLGEALPLYAGGLGVLAGDYLKTASDLGVPLVGVGLLYQQGYFRQVLDAKGVQHEVYPINVPSSLPIQPARDADGAHLSVPVELPGRTLRLLVWVARVGRIALYLLDSNDPLNSPADRGITSQLYGGGTEVRLTQEIALGIGGWRALEALGLRPTICHLNEGHAAFAALERARSFAGTHRLTFKEALWATRAGNVFTTHTPVAAAFDTYPIELLAQYGTEYAAQLGIEPGELLAFGRRNAHDPTEHFNMAFFAARLCTRINAVSRLHGAVSKRIFQPLYPRWPEREVPIRAITNGVHVPTWDSPWADTLWTAACGKERWLGSVEELAAQIDKQDDETLWSVRARERSDLVAYARGRLVRQLAQQGASSRAIAHAENVLDPNVLTLGFARRFTAYKRPELLLRDAARLTRLLTNETRPVQIIVAGKAHPRDEGGKALVAMWATFVKRAEVRNRAVFIEDYDMTLAQELVQGVDVWINTPRRTWEACGTSGMKVLVNGGLNLSIRDGWWAEADAPDVGWTINDEPTGSAPYFDDRAPHGPESDAADAEALYRLLETAIVPVFYERDDRGIPMGWVERMRASMATLTPRFSSNRMLAQYVARAYEPAAEAFARRSADGGALARELARLEAQLRPHWHEVHLAHFSYESDETGTTFSVHAYLGGIDAENVLVQLYADASGDQPDPTICPMERGAPIAGGTNGFIYSASIETARPPEHFTPRIVAHHAAIAPPAEINLIHWLPR